MTLSPMFLRFLTLFALVAGLVGVKRVVDSYESKELHRKDFIQEYVLARALVDGQYPYPPVPDLIRTYFPHDPPKVPWAHPTPHTPPAAFLSIPIGFFPYRVAVTIWVVAELVCLAILVGVLTRWYDPAMRWPVKLLVFLTCLGFGPVIHELWYGQFSLILSVLVASSWLSLRTGRDGCGGALLGSAVALKLAAWPVGLFLLTKGRWRAVLAAGAVVVVLNLAAVGVMGPHAAADYYLKVGPRITKEYRQHDENFSLWTVGGRFFSPDIADVASVFIADPIFPSPSLDRLVTPGLPLFVLIVSLVLAWRCREFDSAFGILVCASLPLNPVAWDHYLLLCAVPIAVILRRLRDGNFPKAMTAVGAICLGIAIVPYPGYLDLAVWLFAKGESHNVKVLPFAAGLVTYLPLVSLAGWTALLYATDGRTRASA
jgi:hypothetical protein